jgi:hypothetical protein
VDLSELPQLLRGFSDTESLPSRAMLSSSPRSSRRSVLLLAAAASVLALSGCAGISVEAEAGDDGAKSSVTVPRPTPTKEAGKQAVVASAALSPAVQAQVDYALAHWKHYNKAEYGVLGDNDCVNFASQSLVARGWQQDDEWYHDGDVYSSSDSWRSSTAFRDWLETRPDLATALDDSKCDQVAVGDIVQFDWDDSGDRDHTGIVTRVTHDGGSTQIFFAGHTEDSDYRSVDTAITVDHPGGVAYYWHIAG